MSTLFFIAATLVSILPYMILIFLPFRAYYRYSFKATFAGAALFVCLAITGATLLFREGGTFTQWHLYNSIIASIMGLLLCLFLIRGNFFKILFNFFVVLCYTKDVDYYSLYLQAYILSRESFGTDVGALVFCHVLMLAFTFPLMWLFMTRLLLPVIESKEHANFWNFLWIIPFSFYALYRIAVSPEDAAASAFISGPGSLPVQAAWSFGTFLSFSMMLQMLKESIINDKLNTSLQTAALRLDMQRREFERLNGAIEDARRSRHNIRQHFVLLDRYAREGDLAGVTSYLEKYIDSLNKTTKVSLCENKTFNAIIQHYAAKAEESDIMTDFAFELPEGLSLPESDVAVLLGNVFENALEACQRQKEGKRFIKAKGAMLSSSLLALTVRNSFDHQIARSGEDFISSKRSEKGIGTESIRHIAERYDGIAKFTYAENVFETSVLLNLA